MSQILNRLRINNILDVPTNVVLNSNDPSDSPIKFDGCLGLTSTISGKQFISFSNTTGIPNTNTRSIGTKLVLLNNNGNTYGDFSIGTSSNHIWYNSESHIFYTRAINRLSISNSGIVNISNNINSTSDTTGALVIQGGVGIGRDCNIGGTGSEALKVTGGAVIGGIISTSDTTNSTSTSTGSIITSGGIGIGGNLNIGGIFSTTDTTNSTSISTGSIITSGGLGVGQRAFINETETNTFIMNRSGFLQSIFSPFAIATDFQFEGRGSFLSEEPFSNTSNDITETSFFFYGPIGLRSSINGRNIILFGTNTGEPNITTRSNGSCLILHPNIGTSEGDFSIGVVRSGGNQGIWHNSPRHRFFTQGVIRLLVDSSGINVQSSTNSTSKTTGSIVTSGGVGISGDLYVSNIDNDSEIRSGSLVVGVSGNRDEFILRATKHSILYNQDITTMGTTVHNMNSVTYTNIINVSNGTYNSVSIEKRSYNQDLLSVGTISNFYCLDLECSETELGFGNTISRFAVLHTNTSSATTDAANTYAAIFDEKVLIESTTNSTSKTTGSIVTSGGVGISGDLFVSNINNESEIRSGSLVIESTTNSTSKTTGSIVTSGGVGISGDLFVSNINNESELRSGSLIVGTTGNRDVFILEATGQFNTYNQELTAMGIISQFNNIINYRNDINVPSNGTYGDIIVEKRDYDQDILSSDLNISNFYCLEIDGVQTDLGFGNTISRFAVLHTNTSSETTDASNTYAAIFDEKVLIESTTDVTTSGTGALIVDGGLNIKKKAFIEEQLTVRSNPTVAGNYALYVGAPTGTSFISGSYGVYGSNGNPTTSSNNSGTYSAFFNDRIRVGDFLIVTSDRRLKKNIEDITNWKSILNLQGKTYNLIGKDQVKRTGFIAQDVQKYLPELISKDDHVKHLDIVINIDDNENIVIPQEIIDDNITGIFCILLPNGTIHDVEFEHIKDNIYKYDCSINSKIVGYYIKDVLDVNYISMIPYLVEAVKEIYQNIK